MDWENRVPASSWISIPWRERDGWRHTGARTALNLLLKNAHTEPYNGPEVDWPSWRTFAAATGDPQLTMAGLSPRPVGHRAHHPHHSRRPPAGRHHPRGRPRLPVPHHPARLAGRMGEGGAPGPETYTPALVRYDDSQGTSGWNLRLAP
ncbi:hypothetical protein ACIHFE_29740 [Streptomyces sp. NPDC052396]|uniref:hypothetical protein n=1 Tax=Streptomyces sp. NPDC052396 TaxID=3365689 RepID=UPI0037D7A176